MSTRHMKRVSSVALACFAVANLSAATLTIMPNDAAPGNYDFEWASQTGRVYDLVTHTNLSTPPVIWAVWDPDSSGGNDPYGDLPSRGTRTAEANVPGGGDARRFFSVVDRGKLLFDMIPRYGRISGTATSTFGAGGNYIPENDYHKSDQFNSLRGKIDNGGVSPRIEGADEEARVVFEARGNTSGNDRSELAAGPQFPFGEVYEIRFKFRYDGPVHTTGHFYLLQIWQAVYSPLAGIRMVPGTGDKVEFVGYGIGAAATATLTPGEWVDWTARLKVGNNGFIKVFDKYGNKLGEVNGDFGHTGPNDPQEWRPKFGIYKTANSGEFKVEVNRFLIKEVDEGALQASVITNYYDNFDGSQLSNLQGTAPDTRPGSETWSADTTFKADGSVPDINSGATVFNRSAFLPFSPSAGFIYTLSVDVTQPTGDAATRWAGLAFGSDFMTTGTSVIQGWRSAAALVYRQSGQVSSFYGDVVTSGITSVANGSGTGTQTLKMVLDTTDTNWKVDYFFGSTAVGSHTFDGDLSSPDRPITRVGISINGADDFTSTFDNFSLTTASSSRY